MKYNFDKPVNRFGTGSTKYETLYDGKPLGEDIVPMWVADMDFACAPPILQAVRDSAKLQLFGYTNPKLIPDYYEAVCGYYRRRFNWYIDSKSIIPSPGVVTGIEYALLALTRKGDGIIIQRPVYYPFTDRIEKHGRRVINNALLVQEGRYAIDFEDLEKKAQVSTTTMMILCSPHNPVGRVWTEEELTRIHDICMRNDVIIVSDEIHCDLTREGVTHRVLAAMFPEDRSIITCTAPSKTFNIAGLAQSHIIVPNDEYREKMSFYAHSSINPINTCVVKAAFNDCDDWLTQVKKYIDGNFEFMRTYLKQKLPAAIMSEPQGTYLAWVDVSAYTKDTRALEHTLVKNRALYVEAGDVFGKEGAGKLRINVACPTANVRYCVDALAAELIRLKKGDKMPEFSLPSAWGGKTAVSADSKKKLVVFLRHIGCPFTQLYMARLTAEYDRFLDSGIKVIVVTQNSTTTMESRLNKKIAPYYLLSDTEGEAFAQYCVSPAINRAHLVDESEIENLKTITENGIKNGTAEGDELALPAAFGINSFNRMDFACYGQTAGGLPAPEKLLAMFSRGGIER